MGRFCPAKLPGSTGAESRSGRELNGMSETEGPFTTITVQSYNHLVATLNHLRKRIQTARECLEKGSTEEAIKILKFEEDHG